MMCQQARWAERVVTREIADEYAGSGVWVTGLAEDQQRWINERHWALSFILSRLCATGASAVSRPHVPAQQVKLPARLTMKRKGAFDECDV